MTKHPATSKILLVSSPLKTTNLQVQYLLLVHKWTEVFVTLPISIANINTEFQSWILKFKICMVFPRSNKKSNHKGTADKSTHHHHHLGDPSSKKLLLVRNPEIISSRRILKHIISIHLQHGIYLLTGPGMAHARFVFIVTLGANRLVNNWTVKDRGLSGLLKRKGSFDIMPSPWKAAVWKQCPPQLNSHLLQTITLGSFPIHPLHLKGLLSCVKLIEN